MEVVAGIRILSLYLSHGGWILWYCFPAGSSGGLWFGWLMEFSGLVSSSVLSVGLTIVASVGCAPSPLRMMRSGLSVGSTVGIPVLRVFMMQSIDVDLERFVLGPETKI